MDTVEKVVFQRSSSFRPNRRSRTFHEGARRAASGVFRGATVEEASTIPRFGSPGDAEEALQELDGHPNIGVLFTDVQMPGQMNGLDLAKRVHNDRPDIELIVTSGGVEIADSALPDNGTFLSKPYQASRLVDIVNQKVEDRSVGANPREPQSD